jgi:outer membrane protein
MNRRNSFILLLACVFFIPDALAQDKWDLKKCVEYAMANNISVKQADVQARLSKLQVQQTRLSQYPTASISNSTGISSGRSIDPTTNQFTNQQLLFSQYNFSTGVNVFNWFNTRNTLEGNKLDYEASKANIEKLKNDIALNVATAYLLVLVNKEQVNIARVAVQQSKENLSNTRKRVSAGVLPELSAAELEAQLARDSASLVNQNVTLQQNILQLKAVMNLDAASAFDVDMPPLDQIPVESILELQPDKVYAQALANLPQQRVNDLRIRASQKYVSAARGLLYPSIAAFGGLGTNYANNKVPINVSQTPTGNFAPSLAKVNVGGVDYSVLTPVINTNVTTGRVPFGTQVSENFRQNIGLSLTIPIFNGGNAKTNWERSKLNQQSLELQKEQDNQRLKQDVYLAYTNATTSLERYNAAKKSLIFAKKSFDFSQKRYDVGLLPTIDLLTNQNNLTRSKLDVVSAQVEYVFRMKVLEFYKGQGLKLQ